VKKNFVILFFLLSLNVFGINYYSIGNGNWSDPTMWSYTSGGISCGCTPPYSTSDNIHIETDITLTNNLSIKTGGSLTISGNLHTLIYDLEIKGGGVLEVSGILEINNLNFFNGSFINITSTANVIVHGNLINSNNSDNVTIDGNITVSGTFDNGNGGDILGNGNISAGTFTGTGTTFGFENGIIPPGTTVSTGSLPIELGSFSINCVDNYRVITFTTLSEHNVKHFIIQCSIDGTIWSDIQTIPAIGYSSAQQIYNWVDTEIYSQTIYYQLFECDNDGYTKIFGTYASDCNLTSSEINIYPNPVQHNNDIYVVGSINELKVYDIIGKEVPFKLKDDNTIQGLASGLYIIIVNGIRTFKLIIN